MFGINFTPEETEVMNNLETGEKEPLILLDDSNIIADGELLAIAYYYKFGKDYNIPVKRVYLKHKYKENIHIENIKHIISSIVRKINDYFHI